MVYEAKYVLLFKTNQFAFLYRPAMNHVSLQQPNEMVSILRYLQKNLLLLLHAKNCRNIARFKSSTCLDCAKNKLVIQHIFSCEDKDCSISGCEIAKYLLSHWKNCMKIFCALCLPVKQVIQETNKRLQFKTTRSWRGEYSGDRRMALLNMM